MSDNTNKLTASDLAALLCARICHDLVGPVSALETGLELLNDKDNADMHDDAIELIKVGAVQASAKLQFLRITFGAGSSAPAVIGSDELERLAKGVYPDGKTTIDWQVESESLSKPAARVLLNLVMLSMQAIPLGGTVTVTAKETDMGTSISLLCAGRKARLAEPTERTLSGRAPDDAFDGRTIQPFYTGMIAREFGGSIGAKLDGENVIFQANIPTQQAE